MRIGIVTTWFERGAAYVSRAYRDVLSSRHDVFIYARAGEKSGKGDPRWDGPRVWWGCPGAQGRITAVDEADFFAWVESNGIELLIFNEQHSWSIILACRERGIPTGAYVDYYTRQTVPFFALYDFLLCNTRRHHEVFRFHPNSIFVPWGTDLELFRPRERPRGDEVVFFHSCGMGPMRKGTDLLVEAFAQVSGPAKLVIHAQFTIGPRIPRAAVFDAPERFLPMIEAIVADPRIEYVQAEVPAPGLYHLGDVYVYPSRLEGIGLTVAEALASGLPVVTTDAPPMNEFIRPEINGRLVPVSEMRMREDGYYWPQSVCDVNGLAAAMQSYVDGRQDMAAFSQRARAFAEMRLDWRKNADKLSIAICEAVRQRKRPQKDLINAVRAFESGDSIR